MDSRKRARVNLPPNNNSINANNRSINNGNPIRKRGRFENERKSVGFSEISNTRNYNRNLPPSNVAAQSGIRRPIPTKPGHQVNIPERSLNNIFKAGITRKRKVVPRVPPPPQASVIQPPAFVFPNPNPPLPRFGNAPPVPFNWNAALKVKATNASIKHNPFAPGSGGKRKTRSKRTRTKK